MNHTLKYSLWVAGLAGAAWLAYEEGPKLWNSLKAHFANQTQTGGTGGGGGGGGASFTTQGMDTGDDNTPTPPPNLHKTVSCAPGYYDAGGYCKKAQGPGGVSGGISGGGSLSPAPSGGGIITSDHVQLCPPGQHLENGGCVSDSSIQTQSFVYTHPIHLTSTLKE